MREARSFSTGILTVERARPALLPRVALVSLAPFAFDPVTLDIPGELLAPLVVPLPLDVSVLGVLVDVAPGAPPVLPEELPPDMPLELLLGVLLGALLVPDVLEPAAPEPDIPEPLPVVVALPPVFAVPPVAPLFRSTSPVDEPVTVLRCALPLAGMQFVAPVVPLALPGDELTPFALLIPLALVIPDAPLAAPAFALSPLVALPLVPLVPLAPVPADAETLPAVVPELVPTDALPPICIGGHGIRALCVPPLVGVCCAPAPAAIDAVRTRVTLAARDRASR